MDGRFTQLKKKRLSSSTLSTLFAFEHGLAPSERRELEALLPGSMFCGAPREKHWLAWVVHATEVGYDYVGLEYWPLFRERTPGWLDTNESRDWIRQQFRRFAREYGGVQPSGAWAGQFSIICWPITHAVLPQDLQHQFVSSLERLGRYTTDLLTKPALLGAAIQSRSFDASSRFRQFVKNTELVGLIGSALLLQGESVGFEVLEEPALERIVADLEKKRNAKDLLERARARARQTISMHGAIPGQGRLAVTPSDTDAIAIAKLGVGADLSLRPLEQNKWSLILRLPNLSSAAAVLSPEVRQVLGEVRFRVVGDARSRFRAGGALMHPMPDIELVEWPRPGEPLIRFEQSDVVVEEFLSTWLTNSGGPVWLFKLRDDGEAREVRSKTVRPNESYLLVSSDVALSELGLENVPVVFENASAVAFRPADLSSSDVSTVCSRCGLTLASTVRARPTGLPPVNWDGEGNVEWLVTQPKVLAVSSDVDGSLEIQNLRLGSEPLRAEVLANQPAYIDLEPLEPGEHVFELRTELGGAQHSGRVRVVVLEPALGDLDRALPMVLSPSSQTPHLEDVWSGRFSLEIEGPYGHRVRLKVALLRDGGERPLFDQTLPSLVLPVASGTWRDHLQRHLRNNSRAQQSYDLADVCVLTVDGKELGQREFRAEREWTPLRWALSREGNEYCLELRDDRGRLDLPDVLKYEFSSPDKAVKADGESFANRECVGPSGGLYLASTGDFSCAAIVPPSRVHGLTDLAVHPSLRYYERTPAELLSLAECLELWLQARLPGQLAALHPLWQVTSALESKLVEVVAGARWARAERDFRDNPSPHTTGVLAAAMVTNPDHAALVGAVRAQADAGLPNDTQERCARILAIVRLASGFSAYDSSPDGLNRTVEFALRLTTSPASALDWAGVDAERLISRLLQRPVYFRLARWFVLMADEAVGGADYSHPHPSWEW